MLILRILASKLMKLNKKQFKFYRFRTALKRYAEETESDIEIKKDNSSFLKNNHFVDLGLDFLGDASDLAENVADNLKFLKLISLFDKGREIIADNIETSHMKQPLSEIKNINLTKLIDNLSQYFSEDL